MSTKLYWPDNLPAPACPFEEEFENTSITSKFEDGSMQSRSKFTRSRRKWTLTWNTITRKDYLRLMDFVVHKAKFSANSFMWTDPDSIDIETDLALIAVVGSTKGEKWSNKAVSYWSGKIELTEV